MIDKYKRPRVQRLVPWRSRRTAAAILPSIRDSEFQLAVIAEEFSGAALGRLAGFVLRSISAEHALESGALPGEFLPKELRAF